MLGFQALGLHLMVNFRIYVYNLGVPCVCRQPCMSLFESYEHGIAHSIVSTTSNWNLKNTWRYTSRWLVLNNNASVTHYTSFEVLVNERLSTNGNYNWKFRIINKVTKEKLPRNSSTPTNHNPTEFYLRRLHFSPVYFDQTHFSPFCRRRTEIPKSVLCQNYHSDRPASLRCCQP